MNELRRTRSFLLGPALFALLATAEPSNAPSPPETCVRIRPRFLRETGRYRAADGKIHTYAPPLLWTVPGSGNTMVRQLLEFATAVRTGSIQHDKRLINAGFAGEGFVDHAVIVVKVHKPRFSEGVPVQLTRRKKRQKTTKIWRKYAITSAIGVVRDPFHAAFAEYQLKHTPYGSHASRIERKDFDPEDFAFELIAFAHLWNSTLSRYSTFARTRCYDPRENVPDLGHPLEELCRLGVWRFETLTAKAERVQALTQMLDFMRLPPAVRPSRERVECAFQLSDVAARNIKRPHDDGNGRFITRETAFEMAQRKDKGFICQFWGIVQHHAVKFGYTPLGGAACPIGRS